MQDVGTSEVTTAIDAALAILMDENACDLDAATCSLAGSAVSQRLSMEEVAAAILYMASRSSGEPVVSAR